MSFSGPGGRRCGALLGAAGCTQANPTMLTVRFGNDNHGSSVVDPLDAGRYDLRIRRAGTGRLTFRLRTAASVVYTSSVPCRQDPEHQFTLTAPTRVGSSWDQ